METFQPSLYHLGCLSKSGHHCIVHVSDVFSAWSGAVVFACGQDMGKVTRLLATFTHIVGNVAPHQFHGWCLSFPTWNSLCCTPVVPWTIPSDW